jgi:hypothetical protein
MRESVRAGAKLRRIGEQQAMRWKISRMTSSLLELWRETEPETGLPPLLERIREAMLGSMALHVDARAPGPSVWTRVLAANDIQTLWYLRSDVMGVLSSVCGETLAASQLSQITELFRDQIPAAQFASSQRRGAALT